MLLINPIGIIHSAYKSKDETPIQGVFRPDVEGTVQINAEYADALKDIDMFSHLILVYRFDLGCDESEIKLVKPMLLDDDPHGVLASRNPCRPNFIGICVVRLLGIGGSALRVTGLDVLDNTPLLDIKPYVPRFDCFPDASEGWFEGKHDRPKPCGRE